MRLVEEEHELGLVAVADFGQALVQLGQQPQQQRRVHLRRLHQPVGGEDVDHALAVDGLQQVVDVQHRLAEELVGALLLEREQPALDGADRGRRHIAVVGLEFLRVVPDMLEQRAQVLEVEQQQAVVVGDLERQRQHAFLRFVEIEDAGEQQRSHVGDRRAHRVALLAVQVPEHRRAAGEGGRVDPDQLQALVELGRRAAGLAHAGQVALDVGHEDRNAQRRQALGDDLQRDGLAGAGGAGDEPVAVGKRRQQETLDFAVAGDQHGVGHGRSWQAGGATPECSVKRWAAGPVRRGRCWARRRPADRAAWDFKKAAFSAMISGCKPWNCRRNGLGTAHFFFFGEHYIETWRVAGDDATPDGVRAGRLGDVSQGPACPRFHRQAGRQRR